MIKLDSWLRFLSKLHFLTCPAQAHHAVVFSASSNRCPESIYPISFLNISNLSYVLSQTCPKMCPRTDMSRTCPGHVTDMSRTCTQNVPVLTILGHLQKFPESIFPMSFFYISNFSHVLAQTCLKCVPGRTCPGRVPDVSSNRPCPDHFGTSPNRTSATKISTPQTQM